MSPEALVQAARNGKVMITTAESCTGGMLAAAITDIAGASECFDCAFITYSNEAKTTMLGVPRSMVSAYGAVSAEVAHSMAQGALAHSRATLAIAITGIAGPTGGTVEKPVGLVHFACAGKSGYMAHEKMQFSGSRGNIRSAACAHALQMLGKALLL